MPAHYDSSRILLPVKPWFIYASLMIALLLNFLPTAYWPGVPDWMALVLVFWSIREPRFIGMGTGFCAGLLMDVADATVLGQHALAYVIITYIASAISRRVLWFHIPKQSLHVLPLMLLVQLIQYGAQWIRHSELAGAEYFMGPIVATLLWGPVTFALLLPQHQPVSRDENRPI